jgi:hypothetical protein
MTICIAAAAAEKSAVVVASDKMISAGFLDLEFDHPGSKIEALGASCVGLSAGDALPAGDLFSSAQSVATQLQTPQVRQIAETIKDTYSTLRSKRIEETVFKPRGVTIDSFYQQGLIRQFPPEVAMSLDDRVQRMKFGVELIVAGVDRDGAHIFGITDPGISDSYDQIGYHAIGSGMSHALLSLVGAGQHWSMTVNETVFNVFRAKRQSEVAPGVGRSVELRVIADGKIHIVTDDEISSLDQMLRDLEAPLGEQIKASIAQLPFKPAKEK